MFFVSVAPCVKRSGHPALAPRAFAQPRQPPARPRVSDSLPSLDRAAAKRRSNGRANGTPRPSAAHRPPASSPAPVPAQDATAALLLSHRRLIGRLNGICDGLASRLEAHLSGAAGALDCLGERETPAHLLDLLTRSVAKLVPLERQAHNLEDIAPELDELSDAERAAAIHCLLEAVRARGTRPPAAPSQATLAAAAGSADRGL
jgi:hypothetical protein